MLEIKNLTLGYSRHPIVHHLNLSVADGEMLAVIGPNGGGKSTLLNGIMGILKPLEGSVEKEARHQDSLLPAGKPDQQKLPDYRA